MITSQALVKKFDHFTALDNLDATIENGSIYGLIGSNGSGKSTFLRLASGIYKPDGGNITIDGVPIYENTELKNRILFVPDDLYFFQSANILEMGSFYKRLYSSWSDERFRKLCDIFPLDTKKKINTFSKGMKRQSALIFALSAQPDYLYLDEAFDGLDPVIRVTIRRLLAEDIANRGMSVIISSHNLRELEDMCDHIGLLHQGKILFQRDIDELKLGFSKVQVAFAPGFNPEQLNKLEILQMSTQGSLYRLIAKGSADEILSYLNTLSPIFAESIPLTLEEVFIHEMEAVGYDYNNIVF